MTTSEHHDPRRPVRSCIGCRTRRTGDELVRITRAAGGIVADGACSGRGAWLCRAAPGAGHLVDQSCLDEAIRRSAFAKAWRVQVGPDDERAIRESVGG